MIGISVYLARENRRFNREWIKKAHEHGFTAIFTSLHIPEEDPAFYKELLLELGRQAQYYQMDLFADISPESFRHLQIGIDQAGKLAEWGVTGLRVDYGFGIGEMAALSRQLKLQLNASTLTEEVMEALHKAGLYTENTEASHNYYPRPETGLAREYFLQKNQLLKSWNLRISAFVPGDGQKRQPLFEGLPTLEMHRYVSPVYACLDLMENGLVDSVYVGDLSLRDETLAMFPMVKERIIPLRYRGVSLAEFKHIHEYLNGIQTNRIDPARDVIRIEGSRTAFHNRRLQPNNTIGRPKGTITIDNEKYGRYAGEIQITRTDLEQDDKVNVIGRVIDEDIPLLSLIGGGRKCLLQQVNE
ncbi:MAG: MupG family TIM beta-alpha barrel fold protein [Thermoactinomyces sp.]